MIKDPKQIVTPFAFEVSPELLGLPLATPRLRLAALLLDLLIASILTALGALFLAISASILFFWLAIRNRGSIWWKNLIRYGIAFAVSVIVFAITINMTGKSDDTSNQSAVSYESTNGELITGSNNNVDWGSIAEQVISIKDNDSVAIDDQIEKISADLESSISGNTKTDHDYPKEMFEETFLLNLRNLGSAINRNDTLAIDSLIEKVVPLIASAELNSKNKRISSLISQANKLQEENDSLAEQVDNPSFLRSIKASAEDFGLSLGWIGVYFVLCTALFRGQTIGKRMLNIRVVRLNNKPIGLLYSFERFGGYAAGLATGLLGFAQVYWDANRQGIHDKIAATVVLDTREKSTKKYDELRNEILSDENLLE